MNMLRRKSSEIIIQFEGKQTAERENSKNVFVRYITYIMHYYMPDVPFMEILMDALMGNEDVIMRAQI